MPTTPTRSRKAVTTPRKTRTKRASTGPLLIVAVRRLLTTTSLSVADVARKLKTNRRYVRQLANAHSLPTNRTVRPGGPMAKRVAAAVKAEGAVTARTTFRFSREKLKQVLNTLR